MSEAGWLIGMAVTFSCGFVLGAAWKAIHCKDEIRSILRILERVKKGKAPEGAPPYPDRDM